MSDEKDLRKQVVSYLQSTGLTEDTVLYRATLPEFIQSNEAGESMISANEDPSEAVANVYEQGHVYLARDVGPGLAFVETLDNEWKTDDRKLVSIRVKDVLEQGGRIYPVESVITDRVWYATLPHGHIRVSEH